MEGDYPATEFNELVMREVVLSVVRSPGTDYEVSRAQAITNMIDRWEQREPSFVLPFALLRFEVSVRAD
jgi:hypothetical protein